MTTEKQKAVHAEKPFDESAAHNVEKRNGKTL
jgi:hypothetical protein